jgi:hypothetical protein
LISEYGEDKITIWDELVRSTSNGGGGSESPVECHDDSHVTVATHADIGTRIAHDIDTPAFFVDLDAMEHNVNLIVSRTRAKNVDWRPVVKVCLAAGAVMRVGE